MDIFLMSKTEIELKLKERFNKHKVSYYIYNLLIFFAAIFCFMFSDELPYRILGFIVAIGIGIYLLNINKKIYFASKNLERVAEVIDNCKKILNKEISFNNDEFDLNEFYKISESLIFQYFKNLSNVKLISMDYKESRGGGLFDIVEKLSYIYNEKRLYSENLNI